MAVGPPTDRRVGPADRGARSGDQVDHAEHRARAVQCRAGTADDFDSLERGEVDRQLEWSRSEDTLVHRMTVNEDQDAIVVVGGTAEPSGAEVGVVAVVAQVEATHAGERVFQSAVAELLDFLVCEDRDRAGRLSGCLLVLARGADGHVEQGVEAQGIGSGLLGHTAAGARNNMSSKALAILVLIGIGSTCSRAYSHWAAAKNVRPLSARVIGRTADFLKPISLGWKKL